jgi:hypothetical protein
MPGSVDDPRELTFMLGELYAMKRRDTSIIREQEEIIFSFKTRIAELEQAIDENEDAKTDPGNEEGTA